jgi:CheY-like chemotaxis protein
MANKTGSAPTVLIVDDEKPIRMLERRFLERAGYRVLEAADGPSAIALLDENAPLDLLLADVEMPLLLGSEMARRIRRIRPDLKVLFVTGHVDRLFEEQPLLWEGEAFLDKPFDSAGLLEAVSLLLFGTLNAPSWT